MKYNNTRMSSFVDRGNKLIAEGKTSQAMKLVERGLQYYSNRIINALSPYAKTDAGLIVLVLRHLADEVEKSHQAEEETDREGQMTIEEWIAFLSKED